MTIQDGKATFTVRSIVKSVNNTHADGNGNVNLGNLVKSVNNNTADAKGNVSLGNLVTSVNGQSPNNGAITLALSAIDSNAGTNAIGDNYVRFNNGFQVCWQRVGSSGWKNFPVAFSQTPCVVVTPYSSPEYGAAVNVSTTGFELQGDGDWQYIAVGRWK